MSPAPSSVSMLGEQDQEMMGDRVPGDQMVLGHDADKEGRNKSSLTCPRTAPVSAPGSSPGGGWCDMTIT